MKILSWRLPVLGLLKVHGLIFNTIKKLVSVLFGKERQQYSDVNILWASIKNEIKYTKLLCRRVCLNIVVL
jgi:hypothetical protein